MSEVVEVRAAPCGPVWTAYSRHPRLLLVKVDAGAEPEARRLFRVYAARELGGPAGFCRFVDVPRAEPPPGARREWLPGGWTPPAKRQSDSG